MINKRGELALTVILIIVVVFGVAVVSFIGKIMVDDLNADIQADNTFNNQSKQLSQDITTRYPSVMDGGVVLFLVLLWIAALISAYLIDTQPAFIVVSIILIAIVLIFAMAIEDSYETMVLDSDLTTMPAAFPMTNYILSNLVIVILAIAFSISVVLYGKLRQ